MYSSTALLSLMHNQECVPTKIKRLKGSRVDEGTAVDGTWAIFKKVGSGFNLNLNLRNHISLFELVEFVLWN